MCDRQTCLKLRVKGKKIGPKTLGGGGSVIVLEKTQKNLRRGGCLSALPPCTSEGYKGTASLLASFIDPL